MSQPQSTPAIESDRDFLRWVYETLGELNPSNYHHDDVCALNAKSVEVLLAIQARLGLEDDRGSDNDVDATTEHCIACNNPLEVSQIGLCDNCR